MSLLSPLALLGLLGVAGILIAHRLGQAAPKRIAFAGIRFLRQEQPAVARRRVFSEKWLMLVRIILLCAAVLAIAKPTTPGEPELAILGKTHDAVLVLDTSPSMELRSDGRPLALRAVEQARSVLDALPEGSRVSLWATHQPDRALAELGSSRGEVAEHLERLEAEVFERRTRAPEAGAWLRAGSLVQTLNAARQNTPQEARRPGANEDDSGPALVFYAIADRSQGGLASLSELGDEASHIVAIAADREVAEDDREPLHIGIYSAQSEHAPSLGEGAVQMTAQLRRYGPEALINRRSSDVEVTLELAGRELSRSIAHFEPGQVDAKVEFVHIIPDEVEAASATLTLQLSDDPFPIDDRYHLWLTPNARLDLVFVNGDPSEQRSHDELYFLSTALRSSAMTDRVKIRGWAPSQLEERLVAGELGDVDVVVMANVRALDAESSQALVEAVRGGLGLWITAGDRMSAEAYNARLAQLLPLVLRQAVVAGTAPGRTEAQGQGMAGAILDHPMFAGLERDLELSNTRTRRMFLLEPDPARDPQIALEFDNGAPALLTRELGKGRVALLTTTVDRDWTDLPLRPGFVDLARSSIRWLAKDDSDHRLEDLKVGQGLALNFDGPVIVHDPESRPIPFDPSREQKRFLETLVPGHYRVSSVRGGNESAGGGLTHFVVNIDRSESDTRPGRTPESAITAEHSLAHGQQVPRWRDFAWALLAFLAIEALLRLRPHLRRRTQRA